jgi:hypothetical protein
MPSVFTIEGPDLGTTEKPKPKVGFCKIVRNGRTGCEVKLCFVGKSAKYRTGWRFEKGTSRCPRKGR